MKSYFCSDNENFRDLIIIIVIGIAKLDFYVTLLTSVQLHNFFQIDLFFMYILQQCWTLMDNICGDKKDYFGL